MLNSKEVLVFIQKIEDLLQIPIYLVGGAVRDDLLGEKPKDWDFISPLNPDEIEKAIINAGRKPYTIGKKFGTLGLKITLQDNSFEYVEITSFRNEVYLSLSRKPRVNFVDSLELDLNRRDFTINALALNSQGRLYDNWNGLHDLEKKLIRAVDKPKTRFKDDPLRMLRAIRFATKLNFQIEEETWQKIKTCKFQLLNISKERWIQEMDLILSCQEVSYGLDLLMNSGLLTLMIPELSLQKNYDQNSLYHDFSLWEHTKRLVANVPRHLLDLRWAALLHDIAKPFTKSENLSGYSNYLGHDILGAQIAEKTSKYLKFSLKRQEFICQTILHHLESNSDLKVYDDLGKKI